MPDQTTDAESRSAIALLRSLPDAVLGLGADGRVAVANHAAERLLGSEPGGLLGQSCQAIFSVPGSPERATELHAVIEAAISRDSPHRSLEVTLARLDGASVVAELRIAPWREGDMAIGAMIIGKDLTERRAVERRLLSVVSHELRTPLTSMCGALSVLESTLGETLPPPGTRILGIAHRSIDRLVQHVDRILDASRLDSGLPVVTPQRCQAQALVDEALQAVSGLGEAHGAVVRASVAPLEAWADERLVVQALVLLLGHAMRTSRPGDTITLSVERREAALTFTVGAPGPGSPFESLWAELEAAFPTALDTLIRCGIPHLDAWLCRNAIERQGGRLWREEHSDGDSAVYFSLPAWPEAEASSPVPAPAAPPAFEAATSERPVVSPEAGGRPLNILLADDTGDNRMILEAYLARSPHRLTMVENGLAAFERFKEAQYDVVLMDMQMPVLDGYAATRAIRAWEAAEGRRPTPILALTAFAQADDVARTREAGCDGHLGKPISRKSLLAALNDVAERPPSARPLVTVNAALKALVPDFLANRQEDLDLLRGAARSANWPVVEATAHLLVRLGDSYGFARMGDVGRLVADAARRRDADAVNRLAAELGAYLSQVEVTYQEDRP